ncbi:NUDIX domain-containing protein [Paenibacillus illinoisensis]|uniref:NUDIX domain-containing protein n=1 Tax=Paenibacillus illinoisensis TaxID=59845 RepID=UPI003D2C4B49
MKEPKWFYLNEMEQPERGIAFVIMVAQFQEKYVVVYNNKRKGWEFPGGTCEPGETPLNAAGRELYEETGAIRFNLEPFGIYKMNGNLGMVYYASVEEFNSMSFELPNHEIGGLKLVDALPSGMSFGEMFYTFLDQWTAYPSKGTIQHDMDLTGALLKSKRCCKGETK